MQADTLGRPTPHVGFIRDSEIRAGKIAVTELKAGTEEPAGSEPNIEHGGVLFRRQVGSILGGSANYGRVPLGLLPSRMQPFCLMTH